jgi:hypothetical protein
MSNLTGQGIIKYIGQRYFQPGPIEINLRIGGELERSFPSSPGIYMRPEQVNFFMPGKTQLNRYKGEKMYHDW